MFSSHVSKLVIFFFHNYCSRLKSYTKYSIFCLVKLEKAVLNLLDYVLITHLLTYCNILSEHIVILTHIVMIFNN